MANTNDSSSELMLRNGNRHPKAVKLEDTPHFRAIRCPKKKPAASPRRVWVQKCLSF